MRVLLADSDGSVSLGSAVIAGMSAGFCQFIATNSYEMVKIRLQEQGKLAVSEQLSTLQILRQLGVRGLFTGTSATLLRDVPFSAIYFSSYGLLKNWVLSQPTDSIIHSTMVTGDNTNLAGNFFAGVLAGVVSSWTVTPADCVKTRLQAQTRLPPEQRKYTGLVHCFQTILQEEGPTALFKGATARVAALAPLFGVSLAVFEALQKTFGT